MSGVAGVAKVEGSDPVGRASVVGRGGQRCVGVAGWPDMVGWGGAVGYVFRLSGWGGIGLAVYGGEQTRVELCCGSCAGYSEL